MVQLGTSCSFDSPGLARNEPTLGKRSQGDSTPSVLSFFCEGTLTMKHFMANYVEKAQHTLTQGSLHYRLATLGYQKRNTYGVDTCIF